MATSNLSVAVQCSSVLNNSESKAVYQGIEYTVSTKHMIDVTQSMGPEDVAIGFDAFGHTKIFFKDSVVDSDGAVFFGLESFIYKDPAFTGSLLVTIKNLDSESIENLNEMITDFRGLRGGTCVVVTCSHLKESTGLIKNESITPSGLLLKLIELKRESQFEIEFLTLKKLSLDRIDARFKKRVSSYRKAAVKGAVTVVGTASLSVSTVYFLIQAFF